MDKTPVGTRPEKTGGTWRTTKTERGMRHTVLNFTWDGWPCDRRDAHHAHTAYAQPEDRCYPYPCPGVGAHPATMIGQP